MEATFFLVIEGTRDDSGALAHFRPTALRHTLPEQRPPDGAIMRVEASFSEVALVRDDKKLSCEPPLLRGEFVPSRRGW